MSHPLNRPSRTSVGQSRGRAARRPLGCAFGVAILLLPAAVTAKRSLPSGNRTACQIADAHADFKIVTRPWLALTVDEASARDGSGAVAAVLSNTQHVMLRATAPEYATQDLARAAWSSARPWRAARS